VGSICAFLAVGNDANRTMQAIWTQHVYPCFVWGLGNKRNLTMYLLTSEQLNGNDLRKETNQEMRLNKGIFIH
jgi:hypothetical protein